jgi:serine/threonine protein kinase
MYLLAGPREEAVTQEHFVRTSARWRRPRGLCARAGAPPAPRPRWRLEPSARPVSRGGLAEIFLTEGGPGELAVVLKVLRPELRGDLRARAWLRREGALAAWLQHPSLVRGFGLVALGDGEAVVLERLQGMNLYEHLERHGPLPEDQAWALVEQVAEGLHYLHERGLVHGDLHAGNVMICGGRVKLIDYSLTHRYRRPQERPVGLAGVLAFMSPEQRLGAPVTPAAELYSLGVCLYQALTGALPHEDGAWTLSAPSPRRLRPSVSALLSQVTQRLLATHPQGRPQSAQELLKTLGHARPAPRVFAFPSSPRTPRSPNAAPRHEAPPTLERITVSV